MGLTFRWGAPGRPGFDGRASWVPGNAGVLQPVGWLRGGCGPAPPRCLSRRSSAPPLLRERGGQGRTCTFSMAQVLLAVTAADRERFGRSGGDCCRPRRPASIRNHPRDNRCRSASLTTSSAAPRSASARGDGGGHFSATPRPLGCIWAIWNSPSATAVPGRNFFLPRAVLAGRAVDQVIRQGPGIPQAAQSRHSH